jgi:hypothetical protein
MAGLRQPLQAEAPDVELFANTGNTGTDFPISETVTDNPREKSQKFDNRNQL